MSSNIYGKEMFTVTPIDGMEAVQKNFAKYKNSEETVRQLFGSKKTVPLCRRFQLIERGYAMLLKDDECEPLSRYFTSLSVSLSCEGRKENSSEQPAKIQREEQEKNGRSVEDATTHLRKTQPLSQINQ